MRQRFINLYWWLYAQWAKLFCKAPRLIIRGTLPTGAHIQQAFEWDNTDEGIINLARCYDSMIKGMSIKEDDTEGVAYNWAMYGGHRHVMVDKEDKCYIDGVLKGQFVETLEGRKFIKQGGG
jgi:hypothetical protein